MSSSQGRSHPNLCSVVEGKARRALHIVVPTVTEGAVGAYDDLLTATGELRRGELLLVVPFERRSELVDQVWR